MTYIGMIFLFAGGALFGGLVVAAWTGDNYQITLALYEEKMHRAFRDCGKLSKKIGKQRQIIKYLRANQIPKVKKPYVAAELSH